MNYHYCQSCFKKTAQASDVIKFCSHCGKPFGETTTAVSNVIKPSFPVNQPTSSSSISAYKKLLEKRGIKEDDDEDVDDDIISDSDEINKLPDIKQLSLEVDIVRDTGVPIRSLASGAKRKPKPETSNKSIKINKKKFLQEYQRQAASLRPKK